jgi:hypothetical protein
MTGAVYGFKSAPTARSGTVLGVSVAPSSSASAPAMQNIRAPAPVAVGSNGSSDIPMTDATPAALFAASSLACYFDVPYSSLLLLLGAAAAAYAVYKSGVAAIRWWVWALAAVAVYMYSVGPCSGQITSDYLSAAELAGY